MKASVSRRTFLNGAATAGAGLCLGLTTTRAAESAAATAPGRSATGSSAAKWPIWDQREETALLDVLRSGKWGRSGGGARVKEFETLFAQRMGAKHCIATASGTTALLSALGALNLGPGDEVILPPYTFVATFNVITANFALPVFADVDAATFQIDPAKMAAAITPATRVLLPVHIGGSPCDLDAIAEISRTRGIPLVEDACQALTAEWRGKPVGTQGIAGCFSFQASKNLNSGEGGAVLTNDDAFADQVFNFHTPTGAKAAASLGRGSNYRLTEFQAALLLAQYTRFEQQQARRTENATYLSSLLSKIPGIAPAKLTTGCNQGGWHLFMLRYDSRQFAGLSRASFLQALSREGIAAGRGYGSLNHSPHVTALASNPHYQRLYGAETMRRWLERNACPVNDRLIEESIWFSQTTLLAPRTEMERIATAIASVQKRAGDLARV